MGRPRKYSVRDDVFSTYSAEMAYWVGFLMADGALTRPKETRQTTIKIGVHAQDRDHLERFQRFCETTYPIYEYMSTNGKTPVAEIRIPSQQMADDLARYGVVPNKSHTARVTGGLEHDPHFWRGVVDGDGWISVLPNCQMQLVGARPLLEQFVGWSMTLSDEMTEALVYEHKSIHRVSMNHARLLHVLPPLYANDGPSLPRKRERALAIVNKPRIRKRKP